MMRFKRVRGVRIATIENVIVLDLPGPSPQSPLKAALPGSGRRAGRGPLARRLRRAKHKVL